MEKKTIELKKPTKKEEVPADQQKLSYEELNLRCQQLFEQNSYLMQELQRRASVEAIKRLEFLFDIVKNPTCFTEALTDMAIKEIEVALIVPEEAKE